MERDGFVWSRLRGDLVLRENSVHHIRDVVAVSVLRNITILQHNKFSNNTLIQPPILTNRIPLKIIIESSSYTRSNLHSSSPRLPIPSRNPSHPFSCSSRFLILLIPIQQPHLRRQDWHGFCSHLIRPFSRTFRSGKWDVNSHTTSRYRAE